MHKTNKTSTTPGRSNYSNITDNLVFTNRLVQVYNWSNVHVIPTQPLSINKTIELATQPIVWLSSEKENKEQTIIQQGIPIRISDAKTVETIIPNFHMVAFRATEDLAPNWLSLCLQTGRIPILIGNAITLPFSDQIDYSDAIIVLGEETIELAMLKQIANTTEKDFNKKHNRCKEIWQSFYTLSGIKNGTQKIMTQKKNTKTHIIDNLETNHLNPFPAFTNNGELIREDDLFRSMWMKLGRLFPKGKSKPIICCGAGRFLKRLLNATDGMPHGPDILGIADDNALKNQTIHQYPVRKTEEFSAEKFSAILLTTDSVEDILAERCKKEYGNLTQILRPSQIMTLTSNQNLTKNHSTIKPTRNFTHCKHHPSPLPRKLEAIIVCVGYGDMLAWTLKWNRPQFDNVVIVTSSEDLATQKVAKHNNARLVVSDRYNEESTDFNKGKMLNDGFAALDLDDWIMITDADILFSQGIRRRLMQRALQRDCLYYATRLDAPTEHTEEWISVFMNNQDLINTLQFNKPGRNRMPWGYFQLVNTQSETLRSKGSTLYGENFGTACDVDYAFQEQWHPSTKILLPELTIHIPHGEEGTNWSGRKSAPFICQQNIPLQKKQS